MYIYKYSFTLTTVSYCVLFPAPVSCQYLLSLVVSDIDLCSKVEPQLKYERMSNDLATILSRDAASCLAVHSKVIHSRYCLIP